MKKSIGIALIVFLLSTLVGCGGMTAESATKNFLEAVKAMNKEEITKYVNYEELINTVDESEDTGNVLEQEELVKKIMSGMSYSIIESSEEKDSATVKVEITNIDMKSVMGEVIRESLSYAFSNMFTDELDTEEMEEKTADMISAALENNKDNKVTNAVDIALKKVDGTWKISLDDELQNAIMGDLMRVSDSLEGALSGENDQEATQEEELVWHEKSVGEEIELARIKFTVKSVSETKEIESILTEAQAMEGVKYIILDVEVTNITKESFPFERGILLID